MSGDLVSLRIFLWSGSMPVRQLFRQSAAVAAVPVDVEETDGGAAARAKLAGKEFDIVFADAALPASERASFIADVRATKSPPFIFLLAASKEAANSLSNAGADGVVVMPTGADESRSLIDSCIQLRLPHRVLVVDDSLTMRSIVRKILVASRFRLDVAEAKEGIDALKQIASGKFELVFLDYNMPGLNGVETLSEIKRQYPSLRVVIMTSTADDVIADRARTAGAAAFLKKPFYPADIDAILHRIFGLRAPS